MQRTGRRGHIDTAARSGRVARLATQGGTVANALWSRSRYCEGDSPTMLRNDELNEPSDTHPTAKQASVTVAPCRSSIIARSIRRVIRYE